MGPDGELKHATLSEGSYTNRIDTYGRMLSLTRQMMINDDLGAFLQLPRIIGRMSALKREEAAKWMSANFKNYKPNEAPAVLMPEENHNATRGVFNKWRATMEQKMGGSIDWTKITKEKMRMLSDQMFNAANVPTDVQLEYYQQFQNFQSTLTPN